MFGKKGILATVISLWLCTTSSAQSPIWKWSADPSKTKEHPVMDLLLADCNGDGVDDLVAWVQEKHSGGKGQLKCYAFDGVSGQLLWECNETNVNSLFLWTHTGHWLVYAGIGGDECRVLDLRTGQRVESADEDISIFKAGTMGYMAAHEWEGAAEIMSFYPYASAVYERIGKGGDVSVKIGDLNATAPCAFDDTHALLSRKGGLELRDRRSGEIIWTKNGSEGSGIAGIAVGFGIATVLRKHPPRLEAYAVTSGAPLWSVKMSHESMDSGIFSGPILGEGYIAQWLGAEKGIGFFSCKDGNLVTTIPGGEHSYLSSIKKGQILIKVQSDAVYAYKFGEPQPLWMLSARFPSIEQCGDALLVVDRLQGQLERVDSRSGKIAWRLDIKMYKGDPSTGAWPANPVLSSDGKYIALFNHNSIEFIDAANGSLLEKIDKRENLLGAWPDLETDRVLTIDTGSGAKFHHKQFPGGPICCRGFGATCTPDAGSPELPMFENICIAQKRVYVSSGRDIIAVENPCSGASRTSPEQVDGIANFKEELQRFFLTWNASASF